MADPETTVAVNEETERVTCRPFGRQFTADISKDYILERKDSKTGRTSKGIRLAGLLYLLGCCGQAQIITEELSPDDNLPSVMPNKLDAHQKGFCIRYKATIKLIPNMEFVKWLGLEPAQWKDLSEMLLANPTVAYGSASSNNLASSFIVPFSREMAETRSVARASRFFLKTDLCSVEEMGADNTNTDDFAEDDTLDQHRPEYMGSLDPLKGYAARNPAVRYAARNPAVHPAPKAEPTDRAGYIAFLKGCRADTQVDTVNQFIESHSTEEHPKVVLDQLSDDELKALYAILKG